MCDERPPGWDYVKIVAIMAVTLTIAYGVMTARRSAEGFAASSLSIGIFVISGLGAFLSVYASDCRGFGLKLVLVLIFVSTLVLVFIESQSRCRSDVTPLILYCTGAALGGFVASGKLSK